MDPASGIGIPVAFAAGLISFLSPCVLPLVPGYISAVAGVTPADIRATRVIGLGGAVLIGMGVLIWTGEFTQLNITVNHWLQTLGLPDFNSDT